MSKPATTLPAGPEGPPTGPGIEQITDGHARALLPARAFGTHKWDVGGIVIIGGSPTYIGAVALAALAAQRAGAGVIQLAVPRGIIAPLVPLIPEATYIPLPETESTSGARNAVAAVADKGARAAAVLIGPGLGQDDNAAGLLGALFGAPEADRSIGFGGFTTAKDTTPAGNETNDVLPYARAGKPLVVDADALNWLASQDDWPNLLAPATAVLTPHPGEMSRLLGEDVATITQDPISAVRRLAQRSRQVAILKYGYTTVSDGERVLVAPAAPTSLATAGTGDVLAGTVASLLAQGLEPFDAASLAVYIGCEAALAVEKMTGSLGLVASDLPLAIAEQMALLAGSEVATHV